MIGERTNVEIIGNEINQSTLLVNSTQNIFSTSLSPESIRSLVSEIYKKILYFDFQSAEDAINAIKNISNIDNTSKSIIKVLEICLEISLDKNCENYRMFLNEFLQDEYTPDYYKDLILSTILRIEAGSNPDIAEDRYNTSEFKFKFSKYVYFRFLASLEIIEENFKPQVRLNLSEFEILGLISGAIRHKKLSLAVDVSNYLVSIEDGNRNSQIVALFCKVFHLSEITKGKKYWSFEREHSDELNRQIDKLIELINEASDKRLITALVNLLIMTDLTEQRLEPIHRQFFDEVAVIMPINAVGIGERDNIKKEALLKVSKLEPVSFHELKYLLHLIDQGDKPLLNKLRKWRQDCFKFNYSTELEYEYLCVWLCASICKSEDLRERDFIRKRVITFADSLKQNESGIRIISIISLVDQLLDVGLADVALLLITPYAPNNLWPSPVVLCYLRALYSAEQIGTLASCLNQIDRGQWNQSLYTLEVKRLQYLNLHSEALTLLSQLTEDFSDNMYFWAMYLESLKLSSANRHVLQAIIREIPYDNFQYPTDLTCQFLGWIANNVDVQFAENIACRWYLLDPDGMSIYLTQLHFSSSLTLNRVDLEEDINSLGVDNEYLEGESVVCQEDERSNSEIENTGKSLGYLEGDRLDNLGSVANRYLDERVENCAGGIVYTDGQNRLNKLLVCGIKCTHPDLLDVESDLARVLSEIEIGESVDVGYKKFTLLERIPPRVAILRHAIRSRDINNTGDDCFISLSLSDDPDVMITELFDLMRRFAPNKGHSDEILSNPQIPMYCKSIVLKESDIVKCALKLFCTKSVNVAFRFNNTGVDSPSTCVLDIYSIVYLALSGLWREILNSKVKLLITEETKLFIQHWMESVGNQHMFLGIDGDNLIRWTHEQIVQSNAELIEAIRAITDNSEVGLNSVGDLPQELLQIRDIFDASTYSSMRLAYLNSVPWLCMDSAFYNFSSLLNLPLVNTGSFFQRLTHHTSLEHRLPAMRLNAFVGFPISISFKDVIELSTSGSDNKVFLCASLVKAYGAHLPFSGESENLLADVVSNAADIAFKDTRILLGGREYDPKYYGFFDTLFYACASASLSCFKGETYEERFSRLLVLIAERTENQRAFELVVSFAIRFVSGRFMDSKEVEHIFLKHMDSHDKFEGNDL